MKTSLKRLEDFITHVKDDNIVRAYFAVDTRQQALAQSEEGKPPPIQATTFLILTAKSTDDKRQYIFNLLLKVGRIESEDQFNAYEGEVKALVSRFIEDYQGRYAKCHLIEGVVE